MCTESEMILAQILADTKHREQPVKLNEIADQLQEVVNALRLMADGEVFGD